MNNLTTVTKVISSFRDMREIKFRQLWECQNGHKRWAYFRFPTIEDQLRNINDELILTWGKRNCTCPTHELGEGYHPVGEQQQYTGLKDKNGIEIYEGEIIKNFNYFDKEKTGVIQWNQELCRFEIGNKHDLFYRGTEKDAVVIGNIYENKELLQQNYPINT